MKIGILTNSRAPYRTKQINKFCENKDISFSIYYTKKKTDRQWIIEDDCKAEEIYLKGFELFRFSKFDTCINTGIYKAIKNSDLFFIGGYEQPSYLIAAIICKLTGKKYILLFDGIQPQKIGTKGNIIKECIIRFIVKNAAAIFGNGETSKLYFSKNYGYDIKNIYNQYLTIDTEQIDELYNNKLQIKLKMKEKYNINNDKKILMYVGRLLDWKNINVIFEAVSKLKNKNDYLLFIVGDGPERDNLTQLQKALDVNTVFTGNIANSSDVYEYYFLADLFIFPTSGEAWGLVVNEALAAGLPVLCSNAAGSSFDLVKDGVNGYLFDYNDPYDLSKKIEEIFQDKNRYDAFCLASKEIIKNWTFESSKESFDSMIKNLMPGKGDLD